jgi:hypothetical protein
MACSASIIYTLVSVTNISTITHREIKASMTFIFTIHIFSINMYFTSRTAVFIFFFVMFIMVMIMVVVMVIMMFFVMVIVMFMVIMMMFIM